MFHALRKIQNYEFISCFFITVTLQMYISVDLLTKTIDIDIKICIASNSNHLCKEMQYKLHRMAKAFFNLLVVL